jgi:hypothetical protein
MTLPAQPDVSTAALVGKHWRAPISERARLERRLAALLCARHRLADQVTAIALVILAEVWKTTPFMALLLAGPALVPEDLLKAAAMDGAGLWKRLTKVILPMMKPAILVTLLFVPWMRSGCSTPSTSWLAVPTVRCQCRCSATTTCSSGSTWIPARQSAS